MFALTRVTYPCSLRTGQCHHNGIELVGNLVDGHIEGSGKHHEGHQITQAQQLTVGFYHQQTAYNGQHRILDIAQIVVDGAHDVHIFTGKECVAAKGLVQLVKLLLAGFFMVEDLDNLLSVDHFFDIAVELTEGLLLTDEVLPDLLARVLETKTMAATVKSITKVRIGEVMMSVTNTTIRVIREDAV